MVVPYHTIPPYVDVLTLGLKVTTDSECKEWFYFFVKIAGAWGFVKVPTI